MKTTAYVKDKDTGKYKRDGQGNLLVVGVKEALQIREDKKRYRKQTHTSRKYMSRNPDPAKRVPMKPVLSADKSPHYAFIGGSKTTGDKSYDETFSHEAAVDVLSGLKEMKISAGGKKYHFHFTRVFREPPLKLLNGKLFYPDVWCFFDEERNPDEYALWGGKLAIEVTNTHPCEDVKLLEFELSHIPVFEFEITDSRMYSPERRGGKEDTLTERARHTKGLKDWFEDEIWMKLIVDPVSCRRHEKKCKQLADRAREIEELRTKVENGHVKQQKSIKLYSDQQEKLSLLLADNQELRAEISHKENIILEKDRSLIEKEAVINQKQRLSVLLIMSVCLLLSGGVVFLCSENLIFAAQKVVTYFFN